MTGERFALSVASHRGEGGGVHRGLMGGNTGLGGGGATARLEVEAIAGVGVNKWEVSQPLRTALHTISISLQNSLS